jgi:hypothetical protein
VKTLSLNLQAKIIQSPLMATFTEGSGLVAGPATTAPFLNGSKLALWTGHTINFRGAKYFANPPW